MCVLFLVTTVLNCWTKKGLSCHAFFRLRYFAKTFSVVALSSSFLFFLIQVTGYQRSIVIDVSGPNLCSTELEWCAEICIIPCLVDCCSYAFSKRTYSFLQSICLLTITMIAKIMDVFPVPCRSKESGNQGHVANLLTLHNEMVSRLPCLMMSIEAPSTMHFWLVHRFSPSVHHSPSWTLLLRGFRDSGENAFVVTSAGAQMLSSISFSSSECDM